MVQFEWHDGTVKNVHVDPPFLYEYQVSDGSSKSEYGVPGGAMGAESELPVVKTAPCIGTFPGRDLDNPTRVSLSPSGERSASSTMRGLGIL